MKTILRPLIKPMTAMMFLCASSGPAGSALNPGEVPIDTIPRDVVCLTDSSWGEQANEQVICFEAMTPAEIFARSVGGEGYLELPFHRVVARPTKMDGVTLRDIRDEQNLSEHEQWAMGVCWARIDRLRETKQVVPKTPCWD